MYLILNEYEWAEKRLQDHDLGKKPTETLSKIAKYYELNHYNKRDIRKKLDEFLLLCNPHVSLAKWSDVLDRITKNVRRQRLVVLDGVSVSKSELDQIRKLEGLPLQRLAFTLLCVSKYWDGASSKNNHWVNTPDSDIMEMANIKASIKRQSALYKALKDAGLIRFSKRVDNLNVQVLFSDEEKQALHIHDFRNLGYQYMRYLGGAYFECANCGITAKMIPQTVGRPNKYCKACSSEVRTKQHIEAVMRCRNTG